VSDALHVARRDFTSARRSRLLWGMIAIYVAFSALVFWAGTTVSEPNVPDALFNTMFLTTLLLPLVAIAASYLAIAGERESNTIQFLLGLPVARRSVVAGKFVSRTAMVLLALVASFVVGAAMAVALYPAPEFGLFLRFAGLTTLLIGAYVGTTVAISAMSSNRTQAISGSVGFYFLTDVLWVFGGGVFAVRFVFEELLGVSLASDVYQFIFVLSPAGSYLNTEHLMFDAADYPQLPPIESEAFFIQPWFSVVILAAWMVLPLAVGYWRFSRAEIG
jgi:ABC-2 type transport system permease protein